MGGLRDPKVRLRVFIERGMVPKLPTTWQLWQGQLEMAPYVLAPDAGDNARYAGAPLGHPLLRTPVVLANVGLDHFRVGHGLHARPESLYRHLNFVFHEGMPAFDLQLVQSVPGGLAALRRYTQAIEDGSTRQARRQRRWIDRVLPKASEYRQKFLAPGGWIDQAEAFDYPTEKDVAGFLRPEFTDLVRFVNHCANAYPASPLEQPLTHIPSHLVGLARKRFS
ncbi:MAG: hypothetical protein AB7S68_35520 [Polyangiaceae bacterium]